MGALAVQWGGEGGTGALQEELERPRYDPAKSAAQEVRIEELQNELSSQQNVNVQMSTLSGAYRREKESLERQLAEAK